MVDNFFRTLANTEIQMSTLGFGCAGAWGKSLMGKPMISDEEAQILVEKAYELGVTFFDTGFNYGFAEERLGKILKNSNLIERDKIVIATKFGEEFIDGKWRPNWSVDWMKHSLDTSLNRLGLDYVDLFMCHGGKPSDFSEELFYELEIIKSEGKAKSIGINTFDTDVIKWVIESRKFDFVFLDYNIMRQDREILIKQLYDANIGVIVGAPLAQSLYSNRVFKIKSLKDVWYLLRAFANFRGLLLKGRKFRFINDVEGMNGSQVALRYVLDNPYITSAVFGTTTLKHLEDNLKSRELNIPSDVLEKIKSTK